MSKLPLEIWRIILIDSLDVEKNYYKEHKLRLVCHTFNDIICDRLFTDIFVEYDAPEAIENLRRYAQSPNVTSRVREYACMTHETGHTSWYMMSEANDLMKSLMPKIPTYRPGMIKWEAELTEVYRDNLEYLDLFPRLNHLEWHYTKGWRDNSTTVLSLRAFCILRAFIETIYNRATAQEQNKAVIETFRILQYRVEWQCHISDVTKWASGMNTIKTVDWRTHGNITKEDVQTPPALLVLLRSMSNLEHLKLDHSLRQGRNRFQLDWRDFDSLFFEAILGPPGNSDSLLWPKLNEVEFSCMPFDFETITRFVKQYSRNLRKFAIIWCVVRGSELVDPWKDILSLFGSSCQMYEAQLDGLFYGVDGKQMVSKEQCQQWVVYLTRGRK